MSDSTDVVGQSGFQRLLGGIEAFYLTVLRVAALIVATCILLWAAWLALSALYNLSRSEQSVRQDSVEVKPQEIAQAEAKNSAPEQAKDRTVSAEQQRYYANFVRRYYNLYKQRFETFRQSEDKRLSIDEFDDAFVQTAAKMSAVAAYDLDFASDKADLETLLGTMTAAATSEATLKRLATYRAAKKRQVKKEVRRTRTESRRGWDSYSTSCEGWYYAPYGCAVTRRVTVPYTATVTALEFPKGTVSHTQVFRAMQDRYFALLFERRQAAADKAEAERASIRSGHSTGWTRLGQALWIAGAFLFLMFLFLVIAMERHQRQIASRLNALDVKSE